MEVVNCCYETISECNRCCSPCPHCYDLSVSVLKDILYAINNEIVDYSCGVVSTAMYGYQTCKKLNEDTFNRLLEYKESLNKYYLETIRGQEHCLCPEEIQVIYENVLELVDLSCCSDPNRVDLIMDTSGKDAWNLLHPGCIAFEDWERSTTQLFFKIGITAKKVADPSKIDYEISAKSLAGMCALFSEMHTGYISDPAGVIAALNTASRIKPKVTKKECKLSYELLVSNTKCDISFDLYSKLLECNLTHNAIAKLLECNLTFAPNISKNTCDIVVSPDVTISLCDIDFNISASNTNCTLLAQITGNTNICEELAEIIEITWVQPKIMK